MVMGWMHQNELNVPHFTTRQDWIFGRQHLPSGHCVVPWPTMPNDGASRRTVLWEKGRAGRQVWSKSGSGIVARRRTQHFAQSTSGLDAVNLESRKGSFRKRSRELLAWKSGRTTHHFLHQSCLKTGWEQKGNARSHTRHTCNQFLGGKAKSK